MIYPAFPLEVTDIFPGEHLIHLLANKMHDFRIFILNKCILIFDAYQFT